MEGSFLPEWEQNVNDAMESSPARDAICSRPTSKADDLGVVTPRELLDVVFRGKGEGEVICVSKAFGFSNGSPGFRNMADGDERFTGFCDKPHRQKAPWYFSIATVDGTTNSNGSLLRGRKQLKQIYAVVLDDIGTKAEPPPVEPSWKIETSEGNCQWGYLLEPTDDFGTFEALVAWCAEKGWADGGAGGAYRIMRLPGSTNMKEGRDFWKSRIAAEDWHPDRCWTLPKLIDAFGASVSPRSFPQPLPTNARRDRIDPVAEWLDANGRVISKDEDGRMVVRCPNAAQHSTGDERAYFWPLGVQMGGDGYSAYDRQFKCHHGHCKDLTTAVFLDQIGQAGAPVDKEHQGDPLLTWMQIEGRATESGSGWWKLACPVPVDGTPCGGDGLYKPEHDYRRGYKCRSCGAKTVELLEAAVAAGAPKVLPYEFIAEMNAKYAVVREGGDPLVYWTDENGLQRASFPAHKRAYDNQTAFRWKGNKLEPQKKATAWLNSPKRRQYLKGTTLISRGDVPDGYFNLWNGFGVDPKPGDWSLMDQHIREIVCGGDPELYEYVLNWSARLVQQPEAVGRVALVMRGAEGVGKGVFATALREMLGSHALHLTQPKHLAGNFNAMLQGQCLVFADEAFFAGDPQMNGPLKGLITEERLMIEKKGVDAFEARNMLSVIMATNNDWAVPAGETARRFCVMDVLDTKRGDTAYFGSLIAQMKDGGAAAMLHDLLRRDISGFDVAVFPKTDALRDQQNRSMEGVDRWIYDFLSAGTLPVDENWVVSGPSQTWADSPVEANKLALYENYAETAQRRREHRPLSREAFWRWVKDRLGSAITERQKREQKGRARVIGFKPLEACREAFAQSLGRPFDWDD